MNFVSYLSASKEMENQESGHQDTTHGPGYTPSPFAGHAPSTTPNESIPPHEAKETTDNLEGTTQIGTRRLQSEIWQHFKKVKVNEQDKA